MLGPYSLLTYPFAVAIVIWGVWSPSLASTIFIVVAYGVTALAYALTLILRPRDAPFLFSDSERQAYRRYFLATTFPIASADLGRAVNLLRMVGLLGAPWMAWNHLWVSAVISALLFFLTGALSVNLNPRLFLAPAAAKGNPVAIEQLATLQEILARRDAWRSARAPDRQ